MLLETLNLQRPAFPDGIDALQHTEAGARRQTLLEVLRDAPWTQPVGMVNLFSVAFCSPAKSVTFSGLVENPLVGKKLNVLTAMQNASKFQGTQHQNRFTPLLTSSPSDVFAARPGLWGAGSRWVLVCPALCSGRGSPTVCAKRKRNLSLTIPDSPQKAAVPLFRPLAHTSATLVKLRQIFRKQLRCPCYCKTETGTTLPCSRQTWIAT